MSEQLEPDEVGEDYFNQVMISAPDLFMHISDLILVSMFASNWKKKHPSIYAVKILVL